MTVHRNWNDQLFLTYFFGGVPIVLVAVLIAIGIAHLWAPLCVMLAMIFATVGVVSAKKVKLQEKKVIPEGSVSTSWFLNKTFLKVVTFLSFALTFSMLLGSLYALLRALKGQ